MSKATEYLTKINAIYSKHFAAIQNEIRCIADGAALIAKHGAMNLNDAMYREAKKRMHAEL